MPVDSLPTDGVPTAVLWDMDGTLVDTEPYWIAEERALVEAYGGTWSDEHAHALVGGSLLGSADYIREHSPVDLEPVDLVNRLVAGVATRMEQQIPWRPGARELLLELRSLAVPCALVTMSWRSLALATQEALPPGTFATIVAGDDVSKSKPDPEPYLVAAAQLGVEAADCVAIEDSPTGMTSAFAAGAKTIVVPLVIPVDPPAGVVSLPTLAGVTARDLLGFFS